jgi:hypothetical protein
MATKRAGIEDLVNKTMKGRDIVANVPAGSWGHGTFNPPPKRQVQIRFDRGDYEKLQMIAYRRGTKAAALIREAVKVIIRKDKTGD